jgi:predicted small secreted protein
MRTLSRATLIALAAASALASAACNTVAGAGQDVENVGEAVTDAAEETEDELKDATP